MSKADFLADAAELAAWGETLAGAAMRLGNITEVNLVQRLRRAGPEGRAVLGRLQGNGHVEGHVAHGSVRRWAS